MRIGIGDELQVPGVVWKEGLELLLSPPMTDEPYGNAPRSEQSEVVQRQDGLAPEAC